MRRYRVAVRAAGLLMSAVSMCSVGTATVAQINPPDATTIAALAKAYPTHDAFVRKFNAAVDGIVGLGYWLKPEGDLARAAAAASPVGK